MRQDKTIAACTGTPRALRGLALRYGRKTRLVEALRKEQERRAA